MTPENKIEEIEQNPEGFDPLERIEEADETEGEPYVSEYGKNQMMKELMIGVLLWGMIFQVCFIWLSSDRFLFSTGLWIGVALALGTVAHMSGELNKYVGFASDDEMETHMRKMYFLRMGCLFAVGLAVVYFKLGNIVAMFLGTFTLKFSAYIQPFIHEKAKIIKKGG